MSSGLLAKYVNLNSRKRLGSAGQLESNSSRDHHFKDRKRLVRLGLWIPAIPGG